MKETNLYDRIVELNRAEELYALFLRSSSETEGSLITDRLVGKEKGGEVEFASLGEGDSRRSSGAHHESEAVKDCHDRIDRLAHL